MPGFRVLIMLKLGVLDAAGQAVERGLSALGYCVDGVRVGKVIEVASPDASLAMVHEMCERFLANPLIESWHIEAVPVEELHGSARSSGPARAGSVEGHR